MFLIVLIILPVGFSLLKDYQKDRLLVFVNPNSDPIGAGLALRVCSRRTGVGVDGLILVYLRPDGIRVRFFNRGQVISLSICSPFTLDSNAYSSYSLSKLTCIQLLSGSQV